MPSQTPTIFLLDSCVLIDAHKEYYAPDLCPGFWAVLDYHCAGAQAVRSIDQVRGELRLGNKTDALRLWAEQPSRDSWFEDSSAPDVFAAYARVITFVQNSPQYLQGAKAQFASGADGWLIAHALARGSTIVTHETYDQQIRKKAPIPNICRHFNVRCITLLEMLRCLAVQFNWAPPAP